MNKILKEIRIERFPVYLMITGLFLVLLSFIMTAPSPANNWNIVLREEPNILLFFLGVVVIFLSIYLFWLTGVYNHNKKRQGKGLEPELKVPGQSNDDKFNQNYSVKSCDDLEKRYISLSKTQQRLVTFACEMPQTQMTIDEYYKGFVARYGKNFVANVSELYFRLEALELKGYCKMQKIGPGATIVSVISEVSKCLREKGLLVS
jgi:hypothetical protein